MTTTALCAAAPGEVRNQLTTCHRHHWCVNNTLTSSWRLSRGSWCARSRHNLSVCLIIHWITYDKYHNPHLFLIKVVRYLKNNLVITGEPWLGYQSVTGHTDLVLVIKSLLILYRYIYMMHNPTQILWNKWQCDHCCMPCTYNNIRCKDC